MDSLTQFVLGAAVGEATLGKKLGNTAILLGGLFGTIPDLDVMLNPFFNDVQGLQIHRGVSHSIVFALLFGAFAAWLLGKLFKKREINFKHWFLFTFLALFTHALLDSFTTYGTQLFAPFSNYRVGFNNIFVADLFYTIPFLICLIVCMFYLRTSPKRRFWNWLGIGISSVYMLFTIGAKLYTNQVFEASLKNEKIPYERFTSSPTPLNSFLFSATAETNDGYFLGHYSIFDEDKKIKWTKLNKDATMRTYLNKYKDFEILKWFSDDYFIIRNTDDHIAYIDLRFGPIDYENISGNVKSYPFYFKLFDDGNELEIFENIGEPEMDISMGEYFRKFVRRVAGEK